MLAEWHSEFTSLQFVKNLLKTKRKESKRKFFALLAEYAAYSIDMRDRLARGCLIHEKFTKIQVLNTLKRRKHFRELKK